MKINPDLMKARHLQRMTEDVLRREREANESPVPSLIVGLAVLFLTVLLCSLSYGAEIPDQEAVRCVIGEATIIRN